MDQLEEARREQRREHLNLFWYSFIGLAAFVTGWITINQEEIELFGLLFYGATKSVVCLLVLLVGGVAASFYVLSISSFIFFRRLARAYNRRMHPWKPIAIPLLLGLAGWVLSDFLLAMLQLLTEAQGAINSWFDSLQIDNPFIYFCAIAIFFMLAIFLPFVIGAILLLCFSLPMNINKFMLAERDGKPR